MFLTPHSSPLTPRFWTPAGADALRRLRPAKACLAPFAAKAAQGWRSPLRRRRQGLRPSGRSGLRPSLVRGDTPRNAPLQPTARPATAALLFCHYPLAPPLPLPFPLSPAADTPCPSVDQKVLRCSPRPSVDQRVSRCSPCPFAPLRGSKVLKVLKVFFVPLRGPSWIKRC